jgi:hypothetical protein
VAPSDRRRELLPAELLLAALAFFFFSPPAFPRPLILRLQFWLSVGVLRRCQVSIRHRAIWSRGAAMA